MNVVKQCRDTGLVVLLALMPAAAGAQTPQTSSFAEVPRAIKLGQKVMVTDVDGHKTKGNVDAISASSITLLVRDRWGVDERRSFEQSAVTAIRRTDSLWNGFLIGLGAGIAATEVMVRQNCGPRGFDNECAGIVNAVGWVTFVPGGAAAGALIDKFIGNDLVYRAGGGRSTLNITPLLGAARTGLSVSVRF